MNLFISFALHERKSTETKRMEKLAFNEKQGKNKSIYSVTLRRVQKYGKSGFPVFIDTTKKFYLCENIPGTRERLLNSLLNSTKTQNIESQIRDPSVFPRTIIFGTCNYHLLQFNVF